ncbi:Wzz/FepE/Etk N-terminal domain-containing protein, partial [Nostoc sp. NIES-2111]
MLEYNRSRTLDELKYTEQNNLLDASSVWAREVLRILRRRAVLIGSIGLVGLALGFAYLLIATPVYTAGTSILVGANRINLSNEPALAFPAQNDNLIESQVQILQSETIGRRVVDALNLADDPEFNGTSPPRHVRYANNAVRALAAMLPGTWEPTLSGLLPDTWKSPV